MSDLISRQRAISALNERWSRTDNFDGWGADISEECEEVLNALPSAQPEIIRCKDCKYYGCVLYKDSQFEYGECFGHDDFDVSPDDYCSKAERREYERSDRQTSGD